MKEFGRIVGGTTPLSIAYGIVHDMVTAHVCVEYFTVFHPHLVNSNSPIVMALLWGVLATFWFGAGAGALLGIAALQDGCPRSHPRSSCAGAQIALVVVFCLAMSALVGVYEFAQTAPDKTPDWDYRSRLISVGVTHAFSYAASTVAAFVVAVRIMWRRIRTRSAG